MEKILSHRPLLSNSKNLMYYLKKIDKKRYYSNFGPLYNECKLRL